MIEVHIISMERTLGKRGYWIALQSGGLRMVLPGTWPTKKSTTSLVRAIKKAYTEQGMKVDVITR